MHKPQYCLGLISISCLLLVSCGPGLVNTIETQADQAVSESVETEVGGTEDRTVGEKRNHSFESTEGEIHIVSERVANIDFAIKRFPIDAEQYDSETDKIYKEAFLKAIRNETPLKWPEDGEEVYYIRLLRGERIEEYFEALLRDAGYYYYDFDGDGLPELVIEVDGPTVLKYVPEENQVYIHYRTYNKWYLLGSGQFYYYDSGSAGRVAYSHLTLDENGERDQDIGFQIYYDYDEARKEWYRRWYLITIDVFSGKREPNTSVEAWVSKETWEALTTDFFKAIEHAPTPMTYEEFFAGML